MDVHHKDWKFVPAEPDANFSEERNKSIIQEVIDETDLIAAQKRRAFGKTLEERAWAIATFIQQAKQGKGESDIKAYFGDKNLAFLSGKDNGEKK